MVECSGLEKQGITEPEQSGVRNNAVSITSVVVVACNHQICTTCKLAMLTARTDLRYLCWYVRYWEW